MYELCSFKCLKLYSLKFAIAHAQIKIVLLMYDVSRRYFSGFIMLFEYEQVTLNLLYFSAKRNFLTVFAKFRGENGIIDTLFSFPFSAKKMIADDC